MQNTQINNTKETKAEEFKTGTTTVGLTTEDGVILAADRRASMGHLTSSKKAKKIYELDDNIGLTIAGSVGDAQQIVRIMRSQLKLHKLETRELTVKGASTLLSNILHGSKMMPYMNQFVLGGRDSQENGMLYTLDPAGGLMKHDRFITTGSGSQMAYGVFEDNYEEGMDHEEAKELATRAVQAAMERDTASGNGIMVTEITEDGFNILEEKEVEKRLE
jgi:proteasome beta subunit